MSRNSPFRVLVVEDDALLRWALTETLTAVGHIVAEAVDGASALRRVREAAVPFDAVLLDCCLPDSNELTLLTGIHRWSPTSTVVLMAPSDKVAAAPDAHPQGAAAVWTKPFDMHAVPRALVEARSKYAGYRSRNQGGD